MKDRKYVEHTAGIMRGLGAIVALAMVVLGVVAAVEINAAGGGAMGVTFAVAGIVGGLVVYLATRILSAFLIVQVLKLIEMELANDMTAKKLQPAPVAAPTV